MICLSCKKQIPDDSTRCPECNAEVFHKEQVKKEISFRRYQRWFFYVVLIIVFSGLTGMIIKMYLDKANLLLTMSTAQRTLESKSAELDLAKSDLESKAADLEKIKAQLGGEKEKLSGELTLAETELSKKIDELSGAVDDKLKAIVRYERVNSAFLNISEVAAGISNSDLNKIPVADIWPIGPDTDADGIPDIAEPALGTSATSSDSDADGHSDREELVVGFNPADTGDLGIDQGFADKQKGRVFKQAWGGGYLWYVGQNGKRYFLSPIEQPGAKITTVAISTVATSSLPINPVVPVINNSSSSSAAIIKDITAAPAPVATPPSFSTPVKAPEVPVAPIIPKTPTTEKPI